MAAAIDDLASQAQQLVAAFAERWPEVAEQFSLLLEALSPARAALAPVALPLACLGVLLWLVLQFSLIRSYYASKLAAREEALQAVLASRDAALAEAQSRAADQAAAVAAQAQRLQQLEAVAQARAPCCAAAAAASAASRGRSPPAPLPPPPAPRQCGRRGRCGFEPTAVALRAAPLRFPAREGGQAEGGACRRPAGRSQPPRTSSPAPAVPSAAGG